MDPTHVTGFTAPPQLPPISGDNHRTTVVNPPVNISQPLPSHPSYTEMIMSAIEWENTQGKGGSSKKAIAKYIDRVYTDLPPTHSALLTHHLERLKHSGQLVMIKNSYQLPSFRSQPYPTNPTPTLHHHSPTPPSKRKPGRPPKLHQAQTVSVPGTELSNGSSLGKRPRGRPPKENGAGLNQAQPQAQYQEHQGGWETGTGKRGRGRPPKEKNYGGEEEVVVVPFVTPISEEKRGRGRPPKQTPQGVVNAVVETVGKKRGWPRGKLRGKRVGGIGGGMVVAGKRRGRKPKAGGVGEKRVYSGKPRGRPRKHISGKAQGTANEDLLMKLEEMQSKLRDVVGVIRPHLANQSAPDALAALQQLEQLSTMNITVSQALSAPPVISLPMDVTAPPQSTSGTESFVTSGPSHAAPTMMAFTASPGMNVPLPFGMNVPSLHDPSIGNQQPMSWIPSNEAQS